MCGMPLCLVPGPLDESVLHDIPPDRGAGEFVKTETCARCRLDRRCYGLRRGYAELHGTDELRPIP
jgi:hypothetical protein